MVKHRRGHRKKSKRVKLHNVVFLCFVALWVILTFLCYLGLIEFDSRSLDGAIISGLFLTASIMGAIKLLKVLFDDGLKKFLGEKKILNR